MRAVQFDRFGQEPTLRELAEPVASARGVVVRVETTGLCRSDIHAWLGHDAGVPLPHVPGHELVGVIDSIGPEVRDFAVGERVTTPFACACGRCPECRGGNAQVCRNQTQPGFTHDGSFAELVALHDADVNLVRVPPGVDGGAAALLGCRFATAYRGLAHQGRLQRGETLLVVGCGGVGLSAVMIGTALGARVLAVDVDPVALARAADCGAVATISTAGLTRGDAVDAVRDLASDNGVHVSVDAVGHQATLGLAIRSLGPRGRHVQIGLLAQDPVVPMPEVVARELTVLGSHGMAAGDYPDLLHLVATGQLRPQDLVQHRISLDDVPEAMARMSRGDLDGVTVIDVRAAGAGAWMTP